VGDNVTDQKSDRVLERALNEPAFDDVSDQPTTNAQRAFDLAHTLVATRDEMYGVMERAARLATPLAQNVLDLVAENARLRQRATERTAVVHMLTAERDVARAEAERAGQALAWLRDYLSSNAALRNDLMVQNVFAVVAVLRGEPVSDYTRSWVATSVDLGAAPEPSATLAVECSVNRAAETPSQPGRAPSRPPTGPLRPPTGPLRCTG
jgi:hypothetical protein